MNEAASPYSGAELAMIQRAISPPPPVPPAEMASAMDRASPAAMRPFWKLFDLEPALFARLAADPWVAALGQYAFFPEVLGWRTQGRSIPLRRMTGRTRGPVAVLHSDDTRLAIKPFQNSREDEIARIAAEVGAGPRQYPSLPGYLCEQFADGIFFTDLPPERRSPDAMRAMGAQLGSILRRLHDAGIYYNDATLADPEGRSHLIVADDDSCTLIDFGVSVLLDRHPEYTREEVHNFARTLPMYRIFAGMAENREEMDGFLREFGRRMARATREEIVARDMQFARQGMEMAGRRIGQQIIEPLWEGFLGAYPAP